MIIIAQRSEATHPDRCQRLYKALDRPIGEARLAQMLFDGNGQPRDRAGAIRIWERVLDRCRRAVHTW